ncbi:MAG: efflux transporter outer membrane subunit [Gammaproteobacteria bacterium]
MKKTLIAPCLLILTACTLYQKPEVPPLETPEEFKATVQVANHHMENEWWKNFNDEQLNELVSLALKKNYNYQIALKNIEIAQTYVSQNQSYLFPQVNSAFNSSRNKFVPVEFVGSTGGSGALENSLNNTAPTTTSPLSGGIFNLQELAASVTYEVDIWNQIRNTVKQAQANVVVSAADSNVVKLTLVSGVVNYYFQIMALDINLDNLHKQYRAAKEITELEKVQYKSGLIDASAVYEAEIQEEGILSNIKNIEKQRQILEYTLAYLISEYPENFSIAPHHTLNTLPITHLIPAGIPAEMLAMRPDIQAAYFQVLSYGYLEKQTIANFLPTITLTADYGYASTALPQLLQSSSAFWNYGVGVSQFVFDYAIRMSEYERAKYQFESAILNYKNTVVNAYTEVNSALVSYKEDNEALIALQAQYKSSKELLGVADAQYQAGLADYSAYLTTDLSLLQTEYNVTNQQVLIIQDVIQVYKTLGLGLSD